MGIIKSNIDGLQGSSVLPVGGMVGATLRYDGSAWVTSSTLVNDGTRVGIGTTPTRTLDVNGTVRLGANGTTVANVIKATITTNTTAFVSSSASLTLTWTVTGAATGSSVVVSPQNALPDGLLISYTRVSAANTVEIRFRNVLTTDVVLPVMSYYITVIE